MTIVCPEQFVAALDGRLAATYPLRGASPVRLRRTVTASLGGRDW
jgi:hypothetical protein